MGRNIYPIDFTKQIEEIFFGRLVFFVLGQKFGNVDDRLLAVTQQDGIEKIGYRFGVERTGPPAQKQRKRTVSVPGVKRNCRQVENCQDIGITEFIGQGDTQYIKIGEWTGRFKAGQYCFFLAQYFFQIDIRAIASIGQKILLCRLTSGRESAVPDATCLSRKDLEIPGQSGPVPTASLFLQCCIHGRGSGRGE